MRASILEARFLFASNKISIWDELTSSVLAFFDGLWMSGSSSTTFELTFVFDFPCQESTQVGYLCTEFHKGNVRSSWNKVSCKWQHNVIVQSTCKLVDKSSITFCLKIWVDNEDFVSKYLKCLRKIILTFLNQLLSATEFWFYSCFIFTRRECSS